MPKLIKQPATNAVLKIFKYSLTPASGPSSVMPPASPARANMPSTTPDVPNTFLNLNSLLFTITIVYSL